MPDFLIKPRNLGTDDVLSNNCSLHTAQKFVNEHRNIYLLSVDDEYEASDLIAEWWGAQDREDGELSYDLSERMALVNIVVNSPLANFFKELLFEESSTTVQECFDHNLLWVTGNLRDGLLVEDLELLGVYKETLPVGWDLTSEANDSIQNSPQVEGIKQLLGIQSDAQFPRTLYNFLLARSTDILVYGPEAPEMFSSMTPLIGFNSRNVSVLMVAEQISDRGGKAEIVSIQRPDADPLYLIKLLDTNQDGTEIPTPPRPALLEVEVTQRSWKFLQRHLTASWESKTISAVVELDPSATEAQSYSLYNSLPAVTFVSDTPKRINIRGNNEAVWEWFACNNQMPIGLTEDGEAILCTATKVKSYGPQNTIATSIAKFLWAYVNKAEVDYSTSETLQVVDDRGAAELAREDAWKRAHAFWAKDGILVFDSRNYRFLGDTNTDRTPLSLSSVIEALTTLVTPKEQWVGTTLESVWLRRIVKSMINVAETRENEAKQKMLDLRNRLEQATINYVTYHRMLESEAKVAQELLGEIEATKALPCVERFRLNQRGEMVVHLGKMAFVGPEGDKYDLGEIALSLNITHSSVKIMGTNPQAGLRSGMVAPHVWGDGHACFGTVDADVMQLMAQGKISQLVELLWIFLQTVNHDDGAGCYFFRWPKVGEEEEEYQERVAWAEKQYSRGQRTWR